MHLLIILFDKNNEIYCYAMSYRIDIFFVSTERTTLSLVVFDDINIMSRTKLFFAYITRFV